MDTPLAEMFIAYAGAESGLDRAQLESILQKIWADAREAWPALTVSVDTFIPYLAVRIARRSADLRTRNLAESLATMHTTDLYLACACAANDRRAVELFEAQYLGAVDQALMRLGMPSWVADEAKQILRCHFFLVTKDQEQQKTIEDYSGRGTLRAWVSVAAVHEAFGIVRRPKKQSDLDSSVMRAIRAPGEDVELEYLKRRYAGELEQALRDVFTSLSPRERTVLRSYHTESLGIDGIAALYRIHRVTASRWVKRITEDYLAATRRVLMDRLKADRSEISSVLRLIQSRINATLRAALTSASHDPR